MGRDSARVSESLVSPEAALERRPSGRLPDVDDNAENVQSPAKTRLRSQLSESCFSRGLPGAALCRGIASCPGSPEWMLVAGRRLSRDKSPERPGYRFDRKMVRYHNVADGMIIEQKVSAIYDSEVDFRPNTCRRCFGVIPKVQTATNTMTVSPPAMPSFDLPVPNSQMIAIPASVITDRMAHTCHTVNVCALRLMCDSNLGAEGFA
jgi:hypothetical protein